MSGEEKGLQRLIRHTAPHSQYLNCRNHILALCLVNLIPRYRKLLELDRVLLSLWKMFKYSPIKQVIFEQVQEASNLKFTTSGRSCKFDQNIIKVSSNEHSSVRLDHRKG